ncbi:hypothetical protein BN946_scf184998.g3 [Trametes cinnabarina]|uniref:non-specific serine/threonine protein kinase n=1 Tax=Pycnoporus cinnabarinus TaxID=5643 RepID=A0A060S2V3_PYCCI|nr:hypothetical protein BN946_scf184998.g3 [Trametes cinnabarina]
MARGRRDTQDSGSSVHHRPLRVVASGTLFLTNNLGLPTHPEPNSVIRAHSVSRVRGGSASTCLSIAAQFPSVDAILLAPLGGNEEGRMIINDLEKERDRTGGVLTSAADDTDSRTVINNNPLPDITHEEFISLLGPLLVPENYAYLNAPSTPPAAMQHTPGGGSLAPPSNSQPRASMSAPRPPTNSPAPIDWFHFEGRSVKTTLSNIVGLDGLARERKWRNHCVFSVDVGRRARQGVEAVRYHTTTPLFALTDRLLMTLQLIPHADVIFLNKHYARAHSPQYASSPRAFLLSLTSIAPPHALLVAHWGSDGAAVLSVPTKEYFQSTGWVEPAPPPDPPAMRLGTPNGGRAGEADMQFHKQYRHPTLDVSLTKSRVAGEARALIKCLRSGVNVPGIRMVDAVEGVLGIEWIEGKSVRFLLGGGAEGEEIAEDDSDDAAEEDVPLEEDSLQEYGVSKDTVMEMIGTEIAKMHQADIIHGDLTTSNMMLRHPSSRKGLQLVLIDFGLAYTSTLVEDKAVDLYVLERAFASTHPQSEPLFAGVLKAYEKQMGREWTAISKRLDDVRLRGRKRSMVG